MGAQGDLPPRGPNFFFFFIVIIYFIFVVRSHSKTLGPPSKTYFNSNYPIQKLNKNNKNIHNGDCILAKKKKKNYFATKKPKNHVLLEKLKLNFCNYSKLV